MNVKDKIITINIEVKDRHAIYKEAPAKLVCGNPFNLVFNFDEEWAEFADLPRRAKLVFWHLGRYEDVTIEFTGNICPVPALFSIKNLTVGVYIADEICTTTGAFIECEPSIRCYQSTSVFGAEAADNINNALKGESAYEIAVNEGFKGTKEEWLESLQGPEGKQGPKGEAGEDYVITEEDKTDIANIVTEGLQKQMGDFDTALDSIISMQENLIGTITFTLSSIDLDNDYIALDGMTWGEWVNSIYNVDGFEIYNNQVCFPSGAIVVAFTGVPQTADIVIQNRETYNADEG